MNNKNETLHKHLTMTDYSGSRMEEYCNFLKDARDLAKSAKWYWFNVTNIDKLTILYTDSTVVEFLFKNIMNKWNKNAVKIKN